MKAAFKKRFPIALAVSYAALYAAVLVKNTIFSVGDQTDVIRCGIVNFPLGLILSFVYPGGRNGAFVAVSGCALLNTLVIFYFTRSVIRSSS